MKIEHAAIYYEDIEKAKHFYEKYFHAKSNDMYHNPRTGFSSYFLTFDDGTRLEIMTNENLEENPKHRAQPGFIHLCFALGSKEKVDEMTETFRNDGFEILSGPRITGDGYYETCILDHENNQIEITI